ncbi:hypothetical protein NQD34_010004 [Periophthalmus magnuspinnatus]|nr:hypothetical protein NQD34_010004 [Periophthalmus magnuspinnatus]
MGLEPGNSGILPEDIKLAMEGHMMEGYKFHHDSPLSETDQYFNGEPTLEDKFHILVCVLPANSPHMHETVVEKIKRVRESTKDLNIPDMAIVTKIDLSTKEIMEDVKKVYTSAYLHKNMKSLSSMVGIPLNYMFPVQNYSAGEMERDNDMDILLLTALKHMMISGSDFIDNQLHP